MDGLVGLRPVNEALPCPRGGLQSNWDTARLAGLGRRGRSVSYPSEGVAFLGLTHPAPGASLILRFGYPQVAGCPTLVDFVGAVEYLCYTETLS